VEAPVIDQVVFPHLQSRVGGARDTLAMPSITSLPNELVVAIVDYIHSEADIAALCRVNRRLYDAVSPILYKNAVDRHDLWPLASAAFSGNVRTMKNVLAAGADPNWLFDDTNMPDGAWPRLQIANHERVIQPPNAPLGKGLFRIYHHPHVVAARPGSLMSSHADGDNLVDDDYDEETDDFDVEAFDALHTFGTMGGIEMPMFPDNYLTGADLDGLNVDVTQEDSGGSDLSDTASSTLGSGDRPQNGVLRAHNSPTSRFFTAIHVAAAQGHNEAVQLLLTHGASMTAGCRRLCGCKSVAGMLNHLENPEYRAHIPQWTPLHIAMCYSRPDTVRLLLSRGATCKMEIPCGDERQDSSTALHYAAALGQVELVKYLVEDGHQTDVDVRDSRSLTPFYYAYANSRWDSTIPLLAQMGADINVEIRFYQPYCTITPLGEAVRLGHFGDALKLLDLGADPSRGFVATGAGHRKGLSPLHLGCMRSARSRNEPAKLFDEAREAEERVKLMEALIARGLDIQATDCYGDSPLISAAQNRVLASVKALVAAGADVMARNSLGRSAIMQAILGPSNPLPASQGTGMAPKPETMRILSEILRELITAGARVDDVDPDGNNVLHLLFQTKRPVLPPGIDTTDVIRLLLTYPGGNALLTSRNNEGILAFEVAFRAEVAGAYDTLLRPGLVQRSLMADDLERICKTVVPKPGNACTASIEVLLDLDVDRKFLPQTELFVEAVTGGAWSVVALISRHGLPRLEPKVCTRLMWVALNSCQWDLAYRLVELGADANGPIGDQDHAPVTPLWQLMEDVVDTSYDVLENLIGILVDKGADIHYGPLANDRILHRAIALGCLQLVRTLLRNRSLRDDPRAVGGHYLHTALTYLELISPLPWSVSCAFRIIYVLIRSGADLTELDDNNDYPLAVLLQRLCSWGPRAVARDPVFGQCCDMIKDLAAPGVRINLPNKKGRSIAGYLEDLLQSKAGQFWVPRKLEVVQDASGAKAIRFKPDPRLRKGPEDWPVTTIWDTFE
jgi:ankyrin repeat protein